MFRRRRMRASASSPVLPLRLWARVRSAISGTGVTDGRLHRQVERGGGEQQQVERTWVCRAAQRTTPAILPWHQVRSAVLACLCGYRWGIHRETSSRNRSLFSKSVASWKVLRRKNFPARTIALPLLGRPCQISLRISPPFSDGRTTECAVRRPYRAHERLEQTHSASYMHLWVVYMFAKVYRLWKLSIFRMGLVEVFCTVPST